MRVTEPYQSHDCQTLQYSHSVHLKLESFVFRLSHCSLKRNDECYLSSIKRELQTGVWELLKLNSNNYYCIMNASFFRWKFLFHCASDSWQVFTLMWQTMEWSLIFWRARVERELGGFPPDISLKKLLAHVIPLLLRSSISHNNIMIIINIT